MTPRKKMNERQSFRLTVEVSKQYLYNAALLLQNASYDRAMDRRIAPARQTAKPERAFYYEKFSRYLATTQSEFTWLA